jgi:membrane protein implicated in regulation of membrane protease activity
MTNFYAMYLFLIISVVMLIVGLIFKHNWLFWLSGIGWLATGFYCASIATPTATYVGVFATFCFIMVVVSIVVPFGINQVKPEIPVQRSYQEDMAEKIERMRGHGASFKPKGKDMML